MWHASLTTEHYDFNAYDNSKLAVMTTMKGLMRKHAQQVGIWPPTFWDEYNDGINLREFHLGEGFRDDSLIFTEAYSPRRTEATS